MIHSHSTLLSCYSARFGFSVMANRNRGGCQKSAVTTTTADLWLRFLPLLPSVRTKIQYMYLAYVYFEFVRSDSKGRKPGTRPSDYVSNINDTNSNTGSRLHVLTTCQTCCCPRDHFICRYEYWRSKEYGVVQLRYFTKTFLAQILRFRRNEQVGRYPTPRTSPIPVQ